MTVILPGGLGQIKASGLPFSAWSTVNSGANVSGGPPPSYWGPPNGSAVTFSNQNRTVICATAGNLSTGTSTSMKTGGKLYCEVTLNGVGAGSGYVSIGIVTSDYLLSSYIGYSAYSYGFIPSVNYYSFYSGGNAVGWTTGSGSTPTNGDTFMVAVDFSSPGWLQANFGINGKWLAQGANTTTFPASLYDLQVQPPTVNAAIAYTVDTNGTTVINAGSSAFKYTVPTGYTAWK